MSELDLEAIRQRAELATEGPWKRAWYAGVVQPQSRLMTDYSGYNHCLAEYLSEADAEFIAHARTDIPALLAEVERLRGNASEYRGYEADNALRESENLRKQIYDLRATIERVKALHVREVIAVHEGHGEEAWCPVCQEHYPCETIGALKGAE